MAPPRPFATCLAVLTAGIFSAQSVWSRALEPAAGLRESHVLTPGETLLALGPEWQHALTAELELESVSTDVATAAAGGLRRQLAEAGDEAETEERVGVRSSCPGEFGRCSDHGYCAKGRCLCQAGWAGLDCSLRSEPAKCINGRFVAAPDRRVSESIIIAADGFLGTVCECLDGWAGEACDLRVCHGPGGNCHGHGICLGGTRCRCLAGYAGADCQTSLCETDCSNGRGRCVDGKCRCHAGFTGELCETEACPAACSGHGFCSDDGGGVSHCQCVPGYSGIDCATPLCLTTVPGSPCSGHGRCAPRDGKVATATVTSENQSSSAAVAAAAAAAAAALPPPPPPPPSVSHLFSCSCNPGYTGPDCSLPDCSAFGGCKNNGTCVAGGQCQCVLGFHGSDCSLRSCPNDCGWTHGYCDTEAGVCHCKPGFTGADCSERTCALPYPHTPDAAAWSSLSADGDNNNNNNSSLAERQAARKMGEVLLTTAVIESRRCSGHGSCTVDGVAGGGGGSSCECRSPWEGVDCSYRSCPNACSGTNGYCFLGECFCRPGFAGDDCSRRVCPDDCSGHGSCIEGSCYCSAGWAGPSCASQTCMPHNCSGRGACQEDGSCLCNEGFDGVTCELALCKNGCNGHGICALDGKCRCHQSWQGEDCGQHVCPGSPTPCSARGVCNSATGTCQCFSEFTGLACELQVADVCVHPRDRQLSVTAGTPSLGRGARDAVLTQPGLFEEDQSLFGSSSSSSSLVSQPTIASASAMSLGNDGTLTRFVRQTVCSGYGACGPQGNCTCFPGFSGPFCERCPEACGDHCSGHGMCSEAEILPTVSGSHDSSGSGRRGRLRGIRPKAASVHSLDLVDSGLAHRCDCEASWTGRFCQNRQCPNQCSGHGVCLVTSPDSAISTSTSSTSLKIGAGNAARTHGGSSVFAPPPDFHTSDARHRVIGLLNCFCDPGFGGEDCSRPQPAACNAGSDSNETCSGHGVCERGACFCEDGFAGPQCAVRQCPRQCSGHGTCNVETATCSCDAPWSGGDCATPQCPANCSGNGWCTSIQPVAADRSWKPGGSSLMKAGGGMESTGGGGIAGRRQQPTRAELLNALPLETFTPTFARVVNLQAIDHGPQAGTRAPIVTYRDASAASDSLEQLTRSSASPQCLCKPGFDGADCSHPACHPACTPPHCFCSTEGIAYCARGWSGPACTRRVLLLANPSTTSPHWLPPPTHGRREAAAAELSSSSPSLFSGPHAGEGNRSHCPGGCGANGICVLADVSRRNAPAEASPPPMLQRPGSIPSSERAYHCYCADGWHGAQCQNRFNYSCPFNCSNHGTCVDGRCKCAPGFSGDACDNAAGACPGSTAPCSGHGFCLGSGECSCDALDFGSSLGVESAESGASRHGEATPNAVGHPTARSTQVWFGRDCSCALPCAAGSHCQDGHCICPPGRTGPACSEPACPGQCSGRGTCNADGSCTCDPGFSGPTCGEKVCHPSCTENGLGACRSGGVCMCTDPSVLEVSGCKRKWRSLSTQERVATVLNDYRSLLTAQYDCEALVATSPSRNSAAVSSASVVAGSVAANFSTQPTPRSSGWRSAAESRLLAEISQVKSRVLLHLNAIHTESGEQQQLSSQRSFSEGVEAPATLALEQQQQQRKETQPVLNADLRTTLPVPSSSAALAAASADATATSHPDLLMGSTVETLRQQLLSLPSQCAGFRVSPAAHLSWNRLRFLVSPDTRYAPGTTHNTHHAASSVSASLVLGGGAGMMAGLATDLPGGPFVTTKHDRFVRNLMREAQFEDRDFGGCVRSCSGHGECLAARHPEDAPIHSSSVLRYTSSPSAPDPRVSLRSGALEFVDDFGNTTSTGLWFETCVCHPKFAGVGCHIRAACLPSSSASGSCHGHGSCAETKGATCECDDSWGGVDCVERVGPTDGTEGGGRGGVSALLPPCVARCKATCQMTCTPPSSDQRSPVPVANVSVVRGSNGTDVLADAPSTRLDDRTVLPFMDCFRTCASDCQERECDA